MTLKNPNKKYLRGIGHNLNPVVTVASKGLTDAVITEIDRALNDHELIKVRLSVADRAMKKDTIEAVCEKLNAEAVQIIGHILLLYRKSNTPNPKLSNLLRVKS